MNKNNKGEILRNVRNQIGTILWVLTVVPSVLLSYIHPELLLKLFGIESLSKDLNVAIAIVVFCGTMLLAFPVIVCINVVCNKNKLTEELKEITSKLCIVEDNKNISFIERATLIMSKADFFKELDSARNSVSGVTDIRLMNFSKTIQEQDEEENIKKYYQQEIDFYREKNTVNLFKIVSIHTKEKLKECLNLAKAAEKEGLENFNLAYLNIEKFGDVTLPKIIGVQIIDDNVIFMNPTSARIDTQDNQAVLIKSKLISQIYCEYHKKVWEGIENYHKQWLANKLKDEEKKESKGYIGHILYTGEDGTIAESKVWIDINESLPAKEQLNDKDLTNELSALRRSVPKKARSLFGCLFNRSRKGVN